MKTDLLRNYINQIILKEAFNDIKDVVLKVRLKLQGGSNIPSLKDVMTDLRGIQNVITVRQVDRLGPVDIEGRQVVKIIVGFEDDESYDIPDLMKDIRAHKQCDRVRLISVDGDIAYDNAGNKLKKSFKNK